ncbi:MAG: hypothetical protein GKS07_07005 [Nitrosopumilus sp.]|nr:MAG: hypothetical protein GKS07_07005 [Nitrosopumilus sp.]
MNRNIPLVFSIVLFAGILVPAYAQTSETVVINEVDINPPGDDFASITEWVELYNPTDSDVDISGWKIASTTVLKKTMTISSGTIIGPGEFLTYSYQNIWFTDANESVELRDDRDVVIDKTPLLSDIENDFTSWQRIYDGFDSDSSDDWKFASSTTGSSNGKIVETLESDNLVLTASLEKSSYVFGDVAVISGTVSEEVYALKPVFKPEQIVITIAGPNFDKTLTMYPDFNLSFETSLTLHQVLGINPGTYDVEVKYAEKIVNTEFSVGYEAFEQKVVQDESIGIATDRFQYIPGQFVSLTGFTSEIIPFEGMKFTIVDADDELIASGNLFPSDGQFLTRVFITTVDPSFGTYLVSAEYADKSVSASFEVLEDLKDDAAISLWTDKDAYDLGDEVQISGRLNHVWVSTLDLEIVQTKQSALGVSAIGSDAGFKILDGVRIDGDGFFTYSFTIPDGQNRLGDYRINVSKEVGSASTIIHVVTDTDDFVASDDPLTVSSDKDVYEFGDTITVSGFIEDLLINSSYGSGSAVDVSISHEDGTPLEITTLSKNNNIEFEYRFTAIPETSGRYSVQLDVNKLIFDQGNYVIKSQYGGHTVTKMFAVVDSLNLSDGAILSLDKEVYGLGETVFLTGLVPPTATAGVEISLTKPDGTVTNSGSSVDNQRFSWSWVTPISEKYQSSKIDDTEKSVTSSNFGVYKMKVSLDSFNRELFFKVSDDPENDSLSDTPLFVSTEKSLYKAGEKLKVIGNVIQREQGNEGLVVPDRVTIKVLDGTFPYLQIHESFVYPNQSGEFSSIFELPVTVFAEGSYTVKASFFDVLDTATFSIANDFTFGLDEDVSLLVSADKSEYNPGDVVVITGKPNKLIYLEEFDVSIIQKMDDEITCGSFICGANAGPITSIRPSPSGSFSHQFIIPDSVSSLGSYEVTVDADFEKKSVYFEVVEKQSSLMSATVIEKETRIPEKTISIVTEQKDTSDGHLGPRVITGSLISPSRGEESNVNLKVTAASGLCVIGPDAECLVQKSTRQPGQIYDVVNVDGTNLNVRYSGPDVRLEKFSILPESSSAFLPDANWNVEVIKDDQVSRFYYSVTYKTLG